MDCIFCKIIKGEIPSEKVFENENLIAFNDINPKAEVHILIVPKKHIESVKHLEEVDKNLMGEMILTAKEIAKDLPRIVKAGKNLEGYKLVINVGRKGGQLVDHLHLHLLSPDVNLGV
jgi:histidine triad (HIT) family protein